ncbi:extracellular ribonuclease LE-like [Malania oleifera]|uniref:extracellular ribonuclease LE-like n=1 Tax=Malania oleifera TaxID=397392 RepID=UPI0025AE5A6D|nr:extracellular ribonuclease LE-like [Malania oleifera]
MRKSNCSIFINLLAVLCISAACAAQDFDFFYFVQQWPGSYCDTRQSCCYPATGKPEADFGIHGLWPNYDDGSYPSNCDSSSSFDQSQISDLVSQMRESWPSLACPSSSGIKFWTHEWEKHGTCSESVLDQHAYFDAALALKSKADLLHALATAGIQPGSSYRINSITGAIKSAIGFTPGIECNVDDSGNTQLYQVYLCVDTSASNFINCPVLPRGRCSSTVEFPSF